MKKIILVSTIILTSIVVVYFAAYFRRSYPNIWVANINVGGLTRSELNNTLSYKLRSNRTFKFSFEGQEYNIPGEAINLGYLAQETSDKVFEVGHSSSLISNIKNALISPFTKTTLSPVYVVDRRLINQSLYTISGQISSPPTDPSLIINNSGISINKGTEGSDIDLISTSNKLISNIESMSDEPIEITMVHVNPTLSDNEVSLLKQRIASLNQKSLSMTFENNTFIYKGNDLVKLLGIRGGYNDEELRAIVPPIAAKIRRSPQDPALVVDQGKVKEFSPALEGVDIDTELFIHKLTDTLSSLEENSNTNISMIIPVNLTSPKIKTGEINNLGINELVGRGTSKFKGSIPGRIHNVALAASNISGTLIAPGATFSFNQTLGDVSKFTGYQSAYIIKDGKTILGDGGGVCQVSTTLFRAVLAAGLPIVERYAHAYRVGYYEQDSGPGIDATVYAPSPDFKFKNDTPGYLLLQAQADTKALTLIFEIYGTSDGRKVTLGKPVIANSTPPPPDLYQDDPTLPLGQIKQVEHAAWGAKVSFTYKVERGGETIYSKTFVSNYRPWQAVYLRGTGPAK